MTQANPQARRELILEGLDCANCANKIERGVQKIEGITSCSVNFANLTMVMEFPADQEERLLSQVTNVVHKLEPGVKVIDKRPIKQRAVHSDHGQAQGGCCSPDHKQDQTQRHGEEHSREHDHSHEHGQEHGHEHGHDHGHDHGSGGVWNKTLIARLIGGAALTGVAWAMPEGFLSTLVFAAAYLLIGWDVVFQALRNISRGQVFDEFFLMSIATIGAFLIGEYPEAVGVMLFYQVGELLQSVAVNRSRRSIQSLLAIRPDYANLLTAEGEKKVSPEEIQTGDLILIKPGERVPLDGIVREGRSFLDTSALTGESVPREAETGGAVLSGSINGNGLLKVEVTKVFAESTATKILELVQNASANKAKTEQFMTRFARYYTPFVVITALLLAVIPPLVVSGAEFSDWVYRALIFLVISCPCALVVSVPLGFFGGIGAASKEGILVKGSNYLEALNNAAYVVFDKTGTLTKGVFQVEKIAPVDPYTEEELLTYAAYAEAYSSHPIAVSIRERFGKEIRTEDLADYDEISGHGVQVTVSGKRVLAGNARLMDREGIVRQEADSFGTVVHLAIDGAYAGYLSIADQVKDDSAEAIRELKRMGIRKTVMLTGDSRQVGEAVAAKLGLDEVRTELLPADKVKEIERIEAEKAPHEKILFVGDGINDTPVLARADVGIAMGGLGSDAAIEAADIVIMTDQPSKLPKAISLARRTRRIVMQNILFALGVKAIFLTLGAFGIATMWEAVFSDVGVTLLAVLNSMRVLRTQNL